jgi:hypothetical protein
MFAKTLKIVENGILVKEIKIIVILNKQYLFMPEDRFLLFGSKDVSKEFSVPRKSEVFLDGIMIGKVGASGSLNIKSDRFNGVLHVVYID